MSGTEVPVAAGLGLIWADDLDQPGEAM